MSAKDGSYTLPVLPGPGHLLVKGPTPDFQAEVFGEEESGWGEESGTGRRKS